VNTNAVLGCVLICLNITLSIALQVQQGAMWDSLLSLSPEQPQQMMLSISLKHKQLLTNKSGVTRNTDVSMRCCSYNMCMLKLTSQSAWLMHSHTSHVFAISCYICTSTARCVWSPAPYNIL
jgi:hypothetical protein